jgi:hypothetical protein
MIVVVSQRISLTNDQILCCLRCRHPRTPPSTNGISQVIAPAAGHVNASHAVVRRDRHPPTLASGRGLREVRHGRRGERQRRELDQQQHIVIGGRSVHPQSAAARAAVNEHPPVLAANRDGYRLHASRAISLAVTWGVAIKVPGPQAAWAVVAVRSARRIEGDVYSAMAALKRARKRQI